MIVTGVIFVLFSTVSRIYVFENFFINWDNNIRKVVFLRLDSIITGVLFVLIPWPFISKLMSIFVCLLSLIFLQVAVIDSMFLTLDILSGSFFHATFFFNMTCVGCVGFIVMGKRVHFSKFINSIITFIAKVSYSAYLSNLSIAYLIDNYLNVPSIIKLLIFFPIVFLVSWLTYNYWECKFINHRDKMWSRS